MRRLRIPPAALLLVASAWLSDLVPRLALSIHAVEHIATAALVVILFDGGASIGMRRFREAAVPVTLLGLPGTFLTTGLMALFLHWGLGLGWLTAGLLGAAIAPTDPAVMFSVLGEREIEGRTDTILEGESGANDPVGIALMLGLIELATHAGSSFWVVVRIFCEQMAIGLAVGIAGGLVLAHVLPRISRFAAPLPLVLAAGVYALGAAAGGSGFFAVFVAGLLRGDVEAGRRAELVHLRERLSGVAEVVVFVALGLTLHVSAIGIGRWAQGALVAAVLALVARPIVCGTLLARVRLDLGERLFVTWGGLKGAVPILLAAYALAADVHDAVRIYETVFVVVLFSVVIQGGTIPFAARRLGVEVDPLRPPVAPSASVP